MVPQELNAKFCREEARLPAPKIYVVETWPDNPVGGQYLIMEKVDSSPSPVPTTKLMWLQMPGITLAGDRFEQLDEEQQGRVGTALASMTQKLIDTPVPTSGPYAHIPDLRNLVVEKLEAVRHLAELDVQVDEARLEMKRNATGPSPMPQTTESDPRPFKKVKQDSVPKPKRDPFWRDQLKIKKDKQRCDSLAAFVTLARSCEAVLLASRDNGTAAKFGHYDAHRGNFLFDSVTLELTGMIDLDVAGKVSGSRLSSMHSRRLLGDKNAAATEYWSHLPQAPFAAKLLEAFTQFLEDRASEPERTALPTQIESTEKVVVQLVLAEYYPGLVYHSCKWNRTEVDMWYQTPENMKSKCQKLPAFACDFAPPPPLEVVVRPIPPPSPPPQNDVMSTPPPVEIHGKPTPEDKRNPFWRWLAGSLENTYMPVFY